MDTKFVHYISNKNWDGDFALLSNYNRLYFKGELKRAGIRISNIFKVLEIGYGNGEFLRYVKNCGALIDGIEENPLLVSKAINAGFNAFHSSRINMLQDEYYDLIVAFDVIEHIGKDEILDFILLLKKKLKKGGIIILRFPNGDSPFSLVNQNGDITHKNYIGSLQIRYLSTAGHFSSVNILSQYQPLISRDLFYTLGILIRYISVFFFNIAFWIIFDPKRKILFFDKNLVVHFRL